MGKEFTALQIQRLGVIYYNNHAFIEFIEYIERSAPSFRYYGDTELVFIKYLDSIQGFDFTDVHRYNLSNLFILDQPQNQRALRRFLEVTIHEYRLLRCRHDPKLFFEYLDSYYAELLT